MKRCFHLNCLFSTETIPQMVRPIDDFSTGKIIIINSIQNACIDNDCYAITPVIAVLTICLTANIIKKHLPGRSNDWH